MKIVYFGTYSTAEGYPRNGVVIKSLQAAGVDVITCHREAWGDSSARERGVRNIFEAIKTLLRILITWAYLAWKYLFRTPDHDLVIVGYPGYLDVFLARTLSALRSKPVVLDAFMSLYEAVVEDRKLFAPDAVRARLLKFLDRASSLTAHAVLLDTREHIRYYRDVIGVDTKKFIRVFVGAEEQFYHPNGATRHEKSGGVLFFGSFLPLHGIDVIIKAAAGLEKNEEIHVTLIGDGPQWEQCRMLARETGADINWVRDWIGYNGLSQYIASAEICLGIFSKSDKSGRVIPCKIFNILAMGKPLITADTPATQEVLIHRENAYLIPPGDPEALYEAVETLHHNAELRQKISAGGLALHNNRFSYSVLGEALAVELQRRFGLSRTHPEMESS